MEQAVVKILLRIVSSKIAHTSHQLTVSVPK